MVGDEIEEGVCQIAKEFVYHTKEFGGRESTEIFSNEGGYVKKKNLVLFFREWDW